MSLVAELRSPDGVAICDPVGFFVFRFTVLDLPDWLTGLHWRYNGDTLLVAGTSDQFRAALRHLGPDSDHETSTCLQEIATCLSDRRIDIGGRRVNTLNGFYLRWN